MADETNDVTISKAEPIDPEVAAALTYDTAPPVYDFMFSGDSEVMLGFLSDAWQKSDGIWSHATCTSATRDGSLLGINVGVTAESLHENVMTTIGHAEESLNPLMFERFVELMTWFPYLSPPVPEDAHYVISLAVRDDLRGLGIGRMLLENTFTSAKSEGFDSCHLDVMSTNPAVEFYKAVGMQHYSISQVLNLDQYSIPPLFRMVMPLGDE